MSEKKEEGEEAKAGEAEAKKGAGKAGGINVVSLVLTAVLAGGASFAGAKFGGGSHGGGGGGGGHGAAAEGGHGEGGHGASASSMQSEPPGFTLPLEPFLVMTADANHRPHAMRMVLALEFEHVVTEERARAFVPRIRDAALAHIRGIPYETFSDPTQVDHVRADLLERFRSTGAPGIMRVLVTDLVVQ